MKFYLFQKKKINPREEYNNHFLTTVYQTIVLIALKCPTGPFLCHQANMGSYYSGQTGKNVCAYIYKYIYAHTYVYIYIFFHYISMRQYVTIT